MNKTTKLCNYMKVRSKEEKLKWGLDESNLEPMFKSGIRMFFGVLLDDDGLLIFDNQEPYDGFFYDTIEEIQNIVYIPKDS